MELHCYRHLWGVDDAWEECFARFAAEGYRGVEIPNVMLDAARREALPDLLRRHGLSLILQVFSDQWNNSTDPSVHVRSLTEQVAACADLQPQLINCHSGYDQWSSELAIGFYRELAQIGRDACAPLVHETHRGRTFFNPRDTARVLRAVPDIRLCTDLSHWFCVMERRPDDNADLALALERTSHIHARVGYAEGPQVCEPRDPTYADELAWHEAQWDRIWDLRAAAGDEAISLTPEFGPPPYQHTLPHSQEPVGDLADICLWMARRQAERFDSRA